MRFQILLSSIALVAATAACATAGATYQSGVAPKTFDRPPFYAGNATPSTGSPVVHLAIRYQRGAEQAPLFEPKGDAGSAAAALVAEMNAFLDSLAVSKRVAIRTTEAGTPPDVRFGCPVDAVVPQVCQRAIRLVGGVQAGVNANACCRRFLEKALAVQARVGCDAADLTLIEEVRLVLE